MLLGYIQLLLTLCHLGDLFKPEWLHCRYPWHFCLAGISLVHWQNLLWNAYFLTWFQAQCSSFCPKGVLLDTFLCADPKMWLHLLQSFAFQRKYEIIHSYGQILFQQSENKEIWKSLSLHLPCPHNIARSSLGGINNFQLMLRVLPDVWALPWHSQVFLISTMLWNFEMLKQMFHWFDVPFL